MGLDMIQQKFLQYIDKTTNISEVNEFIDILPPWLYIELYQDTGKIHHITHKNMKSFHSLSSGEKQIFSLIINILYQVKNIISESRYSTINLFLDETEFGLHPNWQKKYVNLLLNALKQFDITIHLIFATHSPFLLSDIPKTNIVFLDEYNNSDHEVINGYQKSSNCKVVDGLNNKKNTFAANIHTLLRDSFFMDSGLMGEFAKDKIEKVIRYLRPPYDTTINDLSMEDIEKIISFIGEPIIKQKIEKLLDNYKIDNGLISIADLDKQISEIQSKKIRLETRLKND